MTNFWKRRNCDLDGIKYLFEQAFERKITAEEAFNWFVSSYRGYSIYVRVKNGQEKKWKIRELLEQGMSINDICRTAKVSFSYVRKVRSLLTEKSTDDK